MGISKTQRPGFLIPNRSRLAEFGVKLKLIFLQKRWPRGVGVHSSVPVKHVHRHRIKITRHTIKT